MAIVYIVYAFALFVLLMSIVFLFPTVSGVSTTRLNVLCLFFDIPQNSVKALERNVRNLLLNPIMKILTR